MLYPSRVPSQSPVNAVCERLQRSRAVWLGLVVTAASTEGYDLTYCQIKTYETGGDGIRFPPPLYAGNSSRGQRNRRKHKTTGQAVLTVNGHDRYLRRYGTPESREAYHRLAAEHLANGRSIDENDPSMIASLRLAFDYGFVSLTLASSTAPDNG